jgi:mRNA interferase RelE/StbE
MPRAKKSLRKLSSEDISSILKKLHAIKEDPFRFLDRLKGSKLWKLRVGDLRVIIHIDTGKSSLYALEIGHRKSIYRRNI